MPLKDEDEGFNFDEIENDPATEQQQDAVETTDVSTCERSSSFTVNCPSPSRIFIALMSSQISNHKMLFISICWGYRLTLLQLTHQKMHQPPHQELKSYRKLRFLHPMMIIVDQCNYTDTGFGMYFMQTNDNNNIINS